MYNHSQLLVNKAYVVISCKITEKFITTIVQHSN